MNRMNNDFPINISLFIFLFFQIAGDDERENIFEYGTLVGKTLAHRMLYVKLN